MTVYVGTSGWQYRHWKGTFYPERLPQAQWLSHYASCFATVEVNNAFYRLPDTSVFDHWAQQTPKDFVMSVKASRYLTHVRRLQEPTEPVRRLLERARHLGPKLGPVLVQLPPNLKADLERLETTLVSFGPKVRVAVEPRHESWFVEDLERLLTRYNCALCLSDRGGPQTPLWRTADWGYVRFHQGRARPDPCYGRQALRTWADRLAELWPSTVDVFAYFNNDERACAPRDARRFALACRLAGLPTTRLPSARQTRLSV